MKTVFDWKTYEEKERFQSKIEKVLMTKHFYQVIADNDAYEDLSSSEMETLFNMFTHGWILAQIASE